MTVEVCAAMPCTHLPNLWFSREMFYLCLALMGVGRGGMVFIRILAGQIVGVGVELGGQFGGLLKGLRKLI
jgi:hypothetical protein